MITTRRMAIEEPYQDQEGITRMVMWVPMVRVQDQISRDVLGIIRIDLNFDTVLSLSGLLSFTQDYYLSLKTHQSSATHFFGVSAIPFQDALKPLLVPVTFEGQEWTLQALPKHPWKPQSREYLVILFLGYLFSLTMGLIVHLFIKRNSSLEQVVKDRTIELSETNADLETSLAKIQEKQAQLLLLNHQLESSMYDLKNTQDKLIQSEKLAALGELVAGIAHELNTPIGTGITLSTYLTEEVNQVNHLMATNQLSKGKFKEFLTRAHETLLHLNDSLNRSADLVQSFKRVSNDQHDMQVVRFTLLSLLEETKAVMNVSYSNTKMQIAVRKTPPWLTTLQPFNWPWNN